MRRAISCLIVGLVVWSGAAAWANASDSGTVVASDGLTDGVTHEASDTILTIGGGPNPPGNQVSLEKNVLYFQRTLKRLGMEGLKHHILFADNNQDQRDLQYRARQRGDEDLHSLLAEIVGPSNGFYFDYRASSIPGIRGPAETEVIDATIQELSQELKAGDRLILYFTGHGGRPRPARGGRPEPAADKDKAEEKKANPDADNFTHLWQSKQLSAKQWTEMLDKLPANTSVVAVMVQCYSGGFGNLIFKGGDPESGVAEQPRCGFFSTVPDRVAAGCTPNVNEAEYREYSSYFYEAISGETRTGETISQPDFDHDGKTSLLEAHAYTVLTADTIDIPIRTSDTLLRHYSATTGKDGLLTLRSPIEVLLATADPCEKAVIEGLSEQFSLNGSNRGEQVEQAIKQKQDAKRKADEALREPRKTVNDAKAEIGKVVRARWPELAAPWHPEIPQMLAEQSGQLLAAMLEHESYAKMREADVKVKELEAKSERLNLDIVKLERLKYWLETRALAINLSIVGDQKKIEAYQRLIRLESQPFSELPTSETPEPVSDISLSAK